MTLELVGSMDEAIDHLHAHGSGHTECIVTGTSQLQHGSAMAVACHASMFGVWACELCVAAYGISHLLHLIKHMSQYHTFVSCH